MSDSVLELMDVCMSFGRREPLNVNRPTFRSAPEVRARVREALEWSGLTGHQTQKATSLSGGEKQRVAKVHLRLESGRLKEKPVPGRGDLADSAAKEARSA